MMQSRVGSPALHQHTTATVLFETNVEHYHFTHSVLWLYSINEHNRSFKVILVWAQNFISVFIQMRCSCYINNLGIFPLILIFFVCIPHKHPHFAFKFLRLTCSISVLKSNSDIGGHVVVRYACYTIQYCTLDIELHAQVSWPWDGGPLNKHHHTRTQGPWIDVACQDGDFQSSIWHHPADDWNAR